MENGNGGKSKPQTVMLKILDRYILVKFLGTFFVAIALILMIAVVFDISEKIEDFVSKGASLREIVMDHYMNFLVFYGNLFSSMIVFIATIFFTSKMTARTELVAMLTGGMSFKRLLYPYFLGATLIAGISLYMSHFVIPKTNETRLNFEWRYIKDKSKERFQNLHRQIRPGHMIFLENYNTRRMSGYHFAYEHFEGQRMLSAMKSDFMRYDTVTTKWRLDNVVIRSIDEDGTQHLRRERRIDTTLALLPEDLATIIYNAEMMPTPELNEFIRAEQLRGSENVNYFIIEKHKRTSWPASTYILVLIALSLSSQKTRGGLGLNIAIGLAICVSYIFFMQISTTFATLSNFPPLLAVWLPNIFFSLLGLYLYARAPK
jgi:lipopolysaccharide export system permease protein